MVSSPSILAAATTLARWARERRAGWTDVPLEIPSAAQTVEINPEPIVHELLAQQADVVIADDVVADDVVIEPESSIARPSFAAVTFAGVKSCARVSGKALFRAIERLGSLGEPAAKWLLRGAAVVSLMSVVMFAAINRGPVLDRWDRVAGTVIAAMNRPQTPPQPVGPPSGTGRLTVAASEGSAQVLIDGASRGQAPLTVDLPAGAHRVLLRSPNGSVERAVRIRAGESSAMTEAIFPGWVALVTPIELNLSEGGQSLRRDERGWAILPPGPHDILLDNRTLGVHEVRHVVVTPGDTTRLSFMPHASAISLTTNEVADVWIDGASFGQAPLVDQPIAVGVHDVRVRSALHERWVRVRATVQPIQINVDLTAQ